MNSLFPEMNKKKKKINFALIIHTLPICCPYSSDFTYLTVVQRLSSTQPRNHPVLLMLVRALVILCLAACVHYYY
jgi:hypothetical protein